MRGLKPLPLLPGLGQQMSDGAWRGLHGRWEGEFVAHHRESGCPLTRPDIRKSLGSRERLPCLTRGDCGRVSVLVRTTTSVFVPVVFRFCGLRLRR